MTNPKCECGFEFECGPGHFRNFNVALRKGGHPEVEWDWLMICPVCLTAYAKVRK
jgi:hypothetical protein